MKAVRLIYLLLPLLLVACHKENDSETFLQGEEVNLKTGRLYRLGTEDLTITVREIQDSRCPVGVYCCWQGEAAVLLDAGNGTDFEVRLSTVHHPADTLHHYIFRLIDVLPYPVYGKDIPDSKKTVILEVRKI